MLLLAFIWQIAFNRKIQLFTYFMSEFFYVDLLVKSGPLNVNSLTWFFNIINRNPTYLRMSVKMILPVDFFPTGLTCSLKWRVSSYRFLYLLYLYTSSQMKERKNQLVYFLKLNWNTLINVQYCALRWSLYIPCKCMVASFIYKTFSIFWFSAFCRCKDGRFSRLRKYCLRCENGDFHIFNAMCTMLMICALCWWKAENSLKLISFEVGNFVVSERLNVNSCIVGSPLLNAHASSM